MRPHAADVDYLSGATLHGMQALISDRLASLLALDHSPVAAPMAGATGTP
jgi:hypothetical protein